MPDGLIDYKARFPGSRCSGLARFPLKWVAGTLCVGRPRRSWMASRPIYSRRFFVDPFATLFAQIFGLIFQVFSNLILAFLGFDITGVGF